VGMGGVSNIVISKVQDAAAAENLWEKKWTMPVFTHSYGRTQIISIQ
jgi:hypothetical protein